MWISTFDIGAALLCTKITFYVYVIPLSPNSDQHQLSPNNLNMLPKEMVTRVNKMITVIKLSQIIL